MKPAAFLFDLDGTLIDSELLWARAIVDWLADCGQKTTVEAFAPLVFGRSWLDIHATIHAEFPALGKRTPIEDARALRPYYTRLAAKPDELVIPGSVDFFRKAASILDVDASECVVVEDSTAGVAAGRAAGMRVIGLDRNRVVQQNFAGCEWLVHDLSEMDVAAVFGN